MHKGFRGNAVVWTCIDRRAKAFIQGDFVVRNRATRQPVPHDLERLLSRGGRLKRTPGVTERRIWTELVQDLGVFGNGIWQRVPGSRSGRTVELWRIDPRYVAIKPTERSSPFAGLAGGSDIEAYLIQTEGGWVPVPPSEIIHWMYPDPHQPWWGLPPLYAAIRDLATDNQLVDHQALTMQNFGVPLAVLELENFEEPDRIKEIRQEWQKSVTGSQRGKIAVAHGGARVKVLGLSMEQLSIHKLAAMSTSRLAMIYGVPTILISESGSMSTGGYGVAWDAAEKHFHFSTIGPLGDAVGENLTQSEMPDGPLECAFDFSRVPVVQEARLERASKASTIFGAGLVSRHAAQRLADLAEAGPDVFYRPSGVDAVIPADATIEEMPSRSEDDFPGQGQPGPEEPEEPDDPEPEVEDEEHDEATRAAT